MGSTAVVVAASVGHVKFVAVLVGARCNLQLTDKQGRTALMRAAMCEDTTSHPGLRDREAAVTLLAKHARNSTARDNDELSATMLAVRAGRGVAASRCLSHCCSCTFTYNGLSSTGIHRNLPGWGSGAHIRLAPQSKSRKQAVAASEQAVEDLQQCVQSAAQVLNEVVGHELVTVQALDSNSQSACDEGPSGAGWIYLSIECFENPKRHGNTISTRWLTHSLSHSLSSCLLAHSLADSLTGSLTVSLADWLTGSLAHSLTYWCDEKS